MSTVVKTAQGEVHGALTDGVHSFLGIPYAAPPVGAGRLRPPRPPGPWDGVRDATRPGPTPPQVAPPDAAGPGWDTGVTGDDYLNLNLWTPDPGASGLPVMVWIQGGAFEVSATGAYDGAAFARDGVVCVVINWRVGPDGFLFLDDGVADVGLLDQVAALEWVQENITAFGGDPGNVTLFGESAGAMSIGVLLSVPRAQGLFRRAIPQSGAAHHFSTPQVAASVGRRLAERLGVPPTRDAVAAVPVDLLLEAQTALTGELTAPPGEDPWRRSMVMTMPWQPVVDGEVVPDVPLARIAAGSAGDVDLLVGTNTDDWRLFTAVTGEIGQVTEEELTGPVSRHGRHALAAYGLDPGPALAAYRDRSPDATPGDILALVQTDWWVRVPAIRLAEAHLGTRARTYMYEFAWQAPGLGAVHGLEVPFVFDTVSDEAPLFGPMLRGAPQELARTVHRAWVAFATDGDPGWPAYELTRKATMRLDTASEVVEDPRAWERALWEGVR